MNAEVQGPNIAELQSMREHQEAGGEKNGFGIGYAEPYATLVDGGKWLLTLLHEGVYAAYYNVLEGCISSCNLNIIWKDVSMIGLKILEKIAEHFQGGEGMPQYNEADYYHPDDFPHSNSRLAHDAEGLHDAHGMGDYLGQYFSPSPSPSSYDSGYDSPTISG